MKMLPAASGAPGTRISFGKLDAPRLDGRRATSWPGRLDPDGTTAHLVERFGQD